MRQFQIPMAFHHHSRRITLEPPYAHRFRAPPFPQSAAKGEVAPQCGTPRSPDEESGSGRRSRQGTLWHQPRVYDAIRRPGDSSQHLLAQRRQERTLSYKGASPRTSTRTPEVEITVTTPSYVKVLLTGPPASGKTTAVEFFQERGLHVLDLDDFGEFVTDANGTSFVTDLNRLADWLYDPANHHLVCGTSDNIAHVFALGHWDQITMLRPPSRLIQDRWAERVAVHPSIGEEFVSKLPRSRVRGWRDDDLAAARALGVPVDTLVPASDLESYRAQLWDWWTDVSARFDRSEEATH